MIILGIKNMYNVSIKKKYIYKFIPRNVYDEIYLSLPLAQYNEKLYDSINPDFILDEEFDYNSSVMNGKWVYFNKDGSLKREQFYKDGKLIEK